MGRKKHNPEIPKKSSLAGKLHEFAKGIGHRPWRFFPEDKGWEYQQEFDPQEEFNMLFAVNRVRKRIISVDMDLTDGRIRFVPNVAKGEYPSIVVGPNYDEGDMPTGVKVWKVVRANLGKQNFRGHSEANYDGGGKLNCVLASLLKRSTKGERRIFAEIQNDSEGMSRNCTLDGFDERDAMKLTLNLDVANVTAAIRYSLQSCGDIGVANLAKFPLKIDSPEQLFELVREEIRKVTGKQDII